MKKRISVVFITLLCMLCLAVTATAASIGDVDGNGKISASDARTALRAAASLTSLTKEQKEAADVDGNGKISASDARMILRVAANLASFDNTPTKPSVPDTDGDLSAKDVHNIAINYTVEVYAILDDEYMSAGSGFFISGDGKIVTNYHVIEGAQDIYIVDCNGESAYVSHILAYDVNMDLAVIQVDMASVPAVVSKSVPETGDIIYTLGNSTGEYYDTFTNGIISNASRVVESYNPNMTYIQHTAPITHGNSGGPLINTKGEVIGINTWGDTSGQNLNFAIPVRYLDMLDMSNPITMEEFAGGVNVPAESFVVASYDDVTLYPGGTACLFFSVQCNLDTFTLTYETSNWDVDLTWGDWYDLDGDNYYETCALFLTGEYYCYNNDLTVYVTEDPSISTTISFTISEDGGGYYFGDFDFPDFGAYMATSPYYCEMNEDMSVTTYSYSADDMIANGVQDYYFDNFFEALSLSGFELADYEETYEYGILYYVHSEYGICMIYTETYDYTGEYIEDVYIDLVYG